MKQTTRYWLFLTAISLILSVILYELISYELMPPFWGWQGLIPAFTVSSIIGKIVINIANEAPEPKELVFVTMVYMGVKTIMHLAIILFYYWVSKGLSVAFIISFFATFLILIALDLYFILFLNPKK